MDLNKTFLMGHVGKDPELRHTQGGTAVVSFSLATGYKPKDGEARTTWHNIVVWGKRAETVNQYVKKGSKVHIEGRIDNRSYDDKDGNKRYTSEVVADNVIFLSGSGIGNAQRQGKPQSNTNHQREAGPAESAQGSLDIPSNTLIDDELPF